MKKLKIVREAFKRMLDSRFNSCGGYVLYKLVILIALAGLMNCLYFLFYDFYQMPKEEAKKRAVEDASAVDRRLVQCSLIKNVTVATCIEIVDGGELFSE